MSLRDRLTDFWLGVQLVWYRTRDDACYDVVWNRRYELNRGRR